MYDIHRIDLMVSRHILLEAFNLKLIYLVKYLIKLVDYYKYIFAKILGCLHVYDFFRR